MNIVKAKFEIEEEDRIDGIEVLKRIEKVARTCYKSEENITEESAKKFVRGLIKRGHEAMIEHEHVTVRLTCDRGVSHEVVRHRLASYGQESTRYCNYGKDKFGNEVTVIDIRDVMRLEIGKTVKDYTTGEPVKLTSTDISFWISEWLHAMESAENHYMNMIKMNCPAQLARSVLANSTKTEIVITMNIREWRHFFSLRADAPAHPQMRELAIPMLKRFKRLFPVLFDDILPEVA